MLVQGVTLKGLNHSEWDWRRESVREKGISPRGDLGSCCEYHRRRYKIRCTAEDGIT